MYIRTSNFESFRGLTCVVESVEFQLYDSEGVDEGMGLGWYETWARTDDGYVLLDDETRYIPRHNPNAVMESPF